MTPPIILLFTCDLTLNQMVCEALLKRGAIVLTTRSVPQALQVVAKRGRELSLALMDFEGGCRGMTLLSAIHTCYHHLPILVTTGNDACHAKAVAYANGARVCLNKPVSAAQLASTIEELQLPPETPLIAA
jgi:CheY-like chemotaxis protein